MSSNGTESRAAADLADGFILATVEVAAPPERVFRALTSTETIDWWVRPGVFDTREWAGDLRVGGRWHASGVGNGRPYELEGEFMEIEEPRRLVHTWHPIGAPGEPGSVTYRLDPAGTGTRITLRHVGFVSAPTCLATAVGWETSFERLGEMLAGG